MYGEYLVEDRLTMVKLMVSRKVIKHSKLLGRVPLGVWREVILF